VADSDLAVALTFAAEGLGIVAADAQELAADTSATAERIDEVDERLQAIQKKLGLQSPPATGSRRLREVPSPAPVDTWDDVLHRARGLTRDMPPDIDDLLTSRELVSIERRFSNGFTVRSRLDRFDIIAAVVAGVTAALLDYLVVATPNEAGLTQALRNLSVDADNWLSGVAKVPFDRVANVDISGFNPQSHRVQTFGHDPLLGWVYGTMDILRGSLTGVSRSGVVKTLHVGAPTAANLPAALGIEAMHLLSDVITPAGLQLPGWSALLTIDKNIAGSDRTVSEVSRWMYVRGYDTWHLPTLAVPILGIEAVLRGYVGLRQLVDETYRDELDLERLRVGSDSVSDLPRYEVMTLIARGIAVAGNAGKFALSGSNPLTLNVALWMAFAKSLLGRLDRARPASAMADTAHMNRLILDAGWVSLEVQKDDLPEIRT